MRKINRITAHLYGVLRSSDHRRANTHLGRPKGNITAAELVGTLAYAPAELNTQVAQIALLVTINKLGNTA